MDQREAVFTARAQALTLEPSIPGALNIEVARARAEATAAERARCVKLCRDYADKEEALEYPIRGLGGAVRDLVVLIEMG